MAHAANDAAPTDRSVGRTLAPALLGGVLLWLALPPCQLGFLGWVAPAAWLVLVRRTALSGAHPYAALWLAGLLFWLPTIHWLRLPHPATWLGWIALACYLACYLPLFVAMVRLAVCGCHLSIVLAAPVVWTGLEWARAHLLTGFLMAALGHTQHRWITLIQISDLAGVYAVSFVVMLVAACLVRMWPSGVPRRITWWPLLVAATVLAAALLYGSVRTANVATRGGPKVALIQGSIEADWKADPTKSGRILQEYYRLSCEAVKLAPDGLDLIVWPETMFPYPLCMVDPTNPAPAPERAELKAANRGTTAVLAELVSRLGTPLLVGVATADYRGTEVNWFNSAVLIDRAGCVAARYNKMHLVMFGEYIPLGGVFPWVYRWAPFTGLTPGREPRVMESAGFRYAPSICFETILPHTIRNQVARLARQGQAPEVLINLTNDGWFWGSSELDMHLTSGVFRAVECRTPLLVAANAGLSAWIDGDGRIVRQGPRQATAVILANVRLDPRTSIYVRIGDWPAALCLAAGVVLTLVGGWRSCWGRSPVPR